ncbi:MAG: hypothetical protein J7M24_04840 [Candidatus Latescibacteria bacterium]|nr:hypothetical protein [Candidatus Latescibacterota bacterium]
MRKAEENIHAHRAIEIIRAAMPLKEPFRTACGAEPDPETLGEWKVGKIVMEG